MYRRMVVLSAPLLLTSCAFDAGSEKGRPCVGPECVRSSGLPPVKLVETVVASQRFLTRFNRSIGPSVDNFLEQYRKNPDDPLLKRLLADFLEPGRRTLARTAASAVMVIPTILPSQMMMVVAAIQNDWRVAKPNDPAYAGVAGKLIDQPAAEARWSLRATAIVTSPSAESIGYEFGIQLHLQTKATNSSEWTNVPAMGADKRASTFATTIFAAIYEEYIQFFRETYGLELKR